MIGKIKKGSGFKGCVNYVLGKEQAVLLHADGVLTESRGDIIRSFCMQTGMNPDLKKPVGHIALSYSAVDALKLTDGKMIQLAQEYMREMKITDTQYIIVRHQDREHPHVHIVFNRIDNDGNLISDSNERIRNAKVCRALTKEYKLYFAPKNSKARNKSRLRPHQLRKYNLRSSTLDALAASRSWHDFFRMLKEKGIDVRFNRAENSDNIRGISFCMDEFSIAGSKLDSDLSFNRLCTTLGNVATELIVQPHQAIVSSAGGGTNNEQGWRDDKNKDNQRNEPFYKTSKRRR